MRPGPGTKPTCNGAVRRTLAFLYPGDLDLLTGGYGYARRLVAELQRLAWEVELISLAPGYPFPSEEEAHLTEQVFAAMPDGHLAVVDGLAFGAMPKIAARHGARLRLVALVHHPLAYETGLDDELAAGLRASEREALRHSRAVVATSAWTARQLVAEFAVEAALISVAPPGTDRFSRAYGSAGGPVIVSLGTLTRRKGHDVLIDALARVADLPWECRIVGDPDRDKEWSACLRRRAAASGVGERITFAGAVEDARSELLAADVFALPSRYEGYGMAFAEALACGLPIVGCSAGAVPDVVPADAGVLAPVDDVATVATALRTLIADPEARSRMAAASLAAGSKLPTWQDTGRSVSSALDRVVGS